MSDNADWVSTVLAGQPAPALPEAVAARIEAALADEVSRRADGVAAAEADRALDELQQRAARGTFGTNIPSHFDKPGLGISEVTESV